MKLKIQSVDQLKTVEVEAHEDDSFNSHAQQAGNLFGYHGYFTLREINGKQYEPRKNLQDDEDFVNRDEDEPLQIVQAVL